VKIDLKMENNDKVEQPAEEDPSIALAKQLQAEEDS
jgi:hypothetical protein